MKLYRELLNETGEIHLLDEYKLEYLCQLVRDVKWTLDKLYVPDFRRKLPAFLFQL